MPRMMWVCCFLWILLMWDEIAATLDLAELLVHAKTPEEWESEEKAEEELTSPPERTDFRPLVSSSDYGGASSTGRGGGSSSVAFSSLPGGAPPSLLTGISNGTS